MMSAPALTAPAREALRLEIHVDAALLDHVTAYILTEKRAELPSWNATPPERLRFRDMVPEAIVTLHLTVPGRTQTEVLQETVGLLTGVGIVQQWIDAPDDARIEEVIVREGADGLAHVQLEVDGQIIDLGDVCPISYFTQMMRRAADNAGQTIKADSPLTVVTLPGGHRLTAIVPPLATTSLSLNVRKFSRRLFALADLVANGTPDQAPAEYLERVAADNAASILIAGNSGTGKTTCSTRSRSTSPPSCNWRSPRPSRRCGPSIPTRCAPWRPASSPRVRSRWAASPCATWSTPYTPACAPT